MLPSISMNGRMRDGRAEEKQKRKKREERREKRDERRESESCFCDTNTNYSLPLKCSPGRR
jgi:hypothetical protein